MSSAVNAVQAIIDAGRRSDAAHDARRQIEHIILAGDVDTVVLGRPCRITVTLDSWSGEACPPHEPARPTQLRHVALLRVA
jgi:hypothetical protein